MLFSSIKERIEHLSEKLVNMPRVGIEPTSPCILTEPIILFKLKCIKFRKSVKFEIYAKLMISKLVINVVKALFIHLNR